MSESEHDVSVEVIDRACAAIEELTSVLKGLGGGSHLDLSAKRNRFRLLCFELLGADARELQGSLPLRAASLTVAAVEMGKIGRCGIREHLTELFPHLSGDDRAFAAGLAMGFMTEFLPREG